MQIFIDGRMLYKSGIGRYLRHIIIETLKADHNLEYLLAGDLKEISRFHQQELAGLPSKAIKARPYNEAIYSWGEQITGSRLARRNNQQDVLFFPHYNAPYYLPVNSVVTVHDLIHFKLAGHYERAKVLFARRVLKNAVQKAGRIIAVSQSTKRDLQEMFPAIPAEKIKVIYQGVGSQFRPAAGDKIAEYKKQRGLARYILFLGNRKPHKNLGRLLAAYTGVVREIPELQLVIGGQRFTALDEVDLCQQKYQLKNLLQFTDLTDQELPLLYSGAQALVLPSLYEGFGLPVLEAMRCHTPVILSRTASLPEVAGQAGVYFDPDDIEEMGQQIYNVLKDVSLRAELKQRGIQQAEKFSWSKTAAETLRVFKQVAERKERGL